MATAKKPRARPERRPAAQPYPPTHPLGPVAAGVDPDAAARAVGVWYAAVKSMVHHLYDATDWLAKQAADPASPFHAAVGDHEAFGALVDAVMEMDSTVTDYNPRVGPWAAAIGSIHALAGLTAGTD